MLRWNRRRSVVHAYLVFERKNNPKQREPWKREERGPITFSGRILLPMHPLISQLNQLISIIS
ncbi:MAG: hypothetical protein V5A47_01045 [Bacteroidales bacterium]